MTSSAVAAIRAFNRFYTRQLGVLERHLMGSPFSLTEARVIYELAQRPDRPPARSAPRSGSMPAISAACCRALSRGGLVAKKPSPQDRRQHRLDADRQGPRRGRQTRPRRRCRSRDDAGAAARLPTPTGWWRRWRRSSGCSSRSPAAAGNPARAIARATWAGWCRATARSTPREYGFDASFEALVAEIAADFIRNFDASRERCWIAELDGRAGRLGVSGQGVATTSPNCGCCWSIRPRAAKGSAPG